RSATRSLVELTVARRPCPSASVRRDTVRADAIRGAPMARLPLTEPEQLPGYLRDLHDGAAEADWSTRHVARVFAAAPELLETYLTRFYYPWHSNAEDAAGVARLTPRLKELVRLRIATLNGCQTCKAARLAAD